MPESVARRDCWNAIGVWGNAECPELKKYVHCRHCGVYSAAAEEALNGIPPPRYLDEWTELVARKEDGKEAMTHSAIIFRIGPEWLALSTSVFQEVTLCQGIHSLPHARGDVVLGLVNVRGQLLICVSLAQALGLERSSPDEQRRAAVGRRLLVVEQSHKRTAFPADEVIGIHEFGSSELKPVPATLTGAAAVYTNGILAWRDRPVGHLDENLLLHALNERLA